MRLLPNTLDGEILRRKLRRNYGDYVHYVNHGHFETKFSRYLCDKIQEFLSAKTDKALDILLLSVPPRHGKSYNVTETLPSWYLGKYPDREVIIASFEGDVAERFNRRNRDKFNNYAEDIFRTKPNKKVQGISYWETEEEGACRAAGLKAGITSYGAHLFIIDDPIKNKEAAQSEAIISKLHDEMNPSVQSRIYFGGKLVVIQTRWVEGDVIGWIKTHWSGYIWADINLPFECIDPINDPLGRKLGEALQGSHMGDTGLPDEIDFTGDRAKSKKALVIGADGEYTWNALYQGNPIGDKGNLFPKDWWQWYNRSNFDVKNFEYICMSVDATFKKTDTSDFVAIGVWGMYKNNAYLYKLVNQRMTFTETHQAILRLCDQFKYTYINDLGEPVEDSYIDALLIEDKANGSAILDVLQYDKSIPSLYPVEPKGGKYSRASAVSFFVRAKRVFLPEDMSHIDEFVEQCYKFPFGAHDDMLDQATQALSQIIYIASEDLKSTKKSFIKYTEWFDDMWEDYNMLKTDKERDDYIKLYGAPLEWQSVS